MAAARTVQGKGMCFLRLIPALIFLFQRATRLLLQIHYVIYSEDFDILTAFFLFSVGYLCGFGEGQN